MAKIKKRLINHFKDVCKSPRAIVGIGPDGYIYGCDLYRIVRLDGSAAEELKDMKLKALQNSSYEIFRKHIENEYSKEDYVMHELPDAKTLHDDMVKTVGRKRNTVLWSDDHICVNARFFVKALEVFNSKIYYSCTKKDERFPIILYEDDDVTSANLECIMQTRNESGEDFSGFKVLENE